MVNKIVATQAEFEQMAEALQDMASAEYLSSKELVPKLLVMGHDSDADVQPTYRWSVLSIVELMSEHAGVPGQVVLEAMIERLITDPEVLVVGYASEAWAVKYTLAEREQLGAVVNPEDSPDRTELVMLNIRSADYLAIKALPIYREGADTKLGTAALMFKPYVALAHAHYVQ